MIGSRVGSPTLPEPLGGPEHTVHDAVGHLRPPEGQGSVLKPGVVSWERDLHFRRTPTELSLRRYALIPPGGNRLDLAEKAPELTPPCWLNAKRGNSTDVFGRLRWDEPALTIRTEFFKPEKGRYLHPEQDRSITHLEAALLQTFDEGYRWTGSKISIARQIGNAVPRGWRRPSPSTSPISCAAVRLAHRSRRRAVASPGRGWPSVLRIPNRPDRGRRPFPGRRPRASSPTPSPRRHADRQHHRAGRGYADRPRARRRRG